MAKDCKQTQKQKILSQLELKFFKCPRVHFGIQYDGFYTINYCTFNLFLQKAYSGKL